MYISLNMEQNDDEYPTTLNKNLRNPWLTNGIGNILIICWTALLSLYWFNRMIMAVSMKSHSHMLTPSTGTHRIWTMCIIIRMHCKSLTHCCLVTPHGDRKLDQHWFRWWLVALRHHYLNQCWQIFSKVFRHSTEGNITRNDQIFILHIFFKVYQIKTTAASLRGQ